MEAGANDRDPIDELAMLADELLQQATEIRQQWSDLAEVLGAELPPAPALPDAAPVAAPAPPAPSSAAPTPGDEDDPIRLVALDMMLSGRSRDEVRAYLSATFGDEDREDVLDEIFTRYG